SCGLSRQPAAAPASAAGVQLRIQLQILLTHAGGGVAPQRPRAGRGGETLNLLGVVTQAFEHGGQSTCVTRGEKGGAAVPQLPGRADVGEDQGAPVHGGLERRQPEGLVEGGGDVQRRTRQPAVYLRASQRAVCLEMSRMDLCTV